MNKGKLNFWLNIILAIAFLVLLATLIAGEASPDVSQEHSQMWIMIHSIAGIIIIAGSTIHLIIHRAFLYRMFSRNQINRPVKKSQQPLSERINVILFIILGLPCLLTGIGLLILGPEMRGSGGIHRMTGWILLCSFTYHFIRHLDWYVKRLRASKRKERTIVST